MMPSITTLAAAQAFAERQAKRILTEDEGERFRRHIRDSHVAAIAGRS